MELPVFGMGCSALGNLYKAIDDRDAVAAVHRAIGAGVTYFDVAPHYGFGMAERRLGAALEGVDREALIVSTKVGRLLRPTAPGGARHGFVDADPFEPVFDYSYRAVLTSHAESQERLGLRHIDLLLAHDLGRDTHGRDAERHESAFLDGGFDAMLELKSKGHVSFLGIGVNETEVCERLLDEIELDVILLAGRYTLLEQGALALLDRCARLGVRVIVGGPFNSGLLVEGAKATRHYNYAPAPASLVRRTEDLARICTRHAIPLPAAALAFPLGHPAVACVLPGLGSVAHVDQFAAWRDTHIPQALWADLREEGLLDREAPVPG